jgi:hypothetical protein
MEERKMKRHEIAAIIGAYSRQGFSATPVSGGIWVDSENVHEYRTIREARGDTGIDFARSIITRHPAYRAQLHA